MEVQNKVLPNPEQMQGFMEAGPEVPIYMVNLLKYKDKAVYEDARETHLSGQEAYNLYAIAVAQLISEFGGHIEFSGKVNRLMLGEVEELWDDIAIAMYPSRKAMLEMMMSPKMQEIGQHRAAGLQGQLNIETTDTGFAR
jgi:uncharacterized protein (DUF1330 family)